MLKQSRRGLKIWYLATISNGTRITPTCSNIWHKHNWKLVGDRTCTPMAAWRCCNRFWTLVELEPLWRPSMTWFCRWRGLRILVHSDLKSGWRTIYIKWSGLRKQCCWQFWAVTQNPSSFYFLCSDSSYFSHLYSVSFLSTKYNVSVRVVLKFAFELFFLIIFCYLHASHLERERERTFVYKLDGHRPKRKRVIGFNLGWIRWVPNPRCQNFY